MRRPGDPGNRGGNTAATGDIDVTSARRPRKPEGNGVSILDEMIAQTPDLLARLDAPPPADAPVPTLPISDIAPDPRQPRRHIRQTTLDALAADIARVGVLQPLVVRPAPDWNGYLIVFGERRYRAALMAGLTHIPAFIRRDLADVDVLELQWQENAQREDVDDIDKAMHLRRMKEAQGLSWSQMADTVHLSRRHLLRMQQLAEMPEGVIEKVRSRELTPSHIYQLARVADAADRSRLADAAAAGRWSVMALSRRIDETTGTEDAAGRSVGDDGVAGAARPSAAGASLTGGRLEDVTSSRAGGGGDAAHGLTSPTQHSHRIDLAGLPPLEALEALSSALSSALDAAIVDIVDIAASPKERRRLADIAAGITETARAAQARLKSS